MINRLCKSNNNHLHIQIFFRETGYQYAIIISMTIKGLSLAEMFEGDLNELTHNDRINFKRLP